MANVILAAFDMFKPGLVSAVATLGLAPRIHQRIQLSRAKHPSLNGHSRVAKAIARLVPFYEHDASDFFCVDAAPAEVTARRRAGFDALANYFEAHCPETARINAEATPGIPDLQFTNRYRVPFQFSRLVRERLRTGGFAVAADGVTVTDLDGNRQFDLAGSYGVNVFGIDFYRECIEEACVRARALGPTLGPLHPIVADNVRRLQKISGMEEVSFHMSGTEAVMQAVRLARYHTGRRYLVRFNGAYHGWWEDVQPGVGNPLPPRDVYTLRDMDERALDVIRTRRDIACVLVNPLQALHPNAAAPGDSTLVDSSRHAAFDREAYSRWLRRLREVCTEAGIPLVFDEVFVGFRLAPGGAQDYFGVRADMVTYGKTLGGGLPVGVVCGPHRLMQRYREDHPVDICFARGTFNSHPYVMAAMQVFLERLDSPFVQACHADLDGVWNRRAQALNERLATANLPVRVANLTSIWSVHYTRPSAYNWMFQYYLKAEDLALPWVGTGRFIFSLNYTEQDFAEVADRFIAAASKMQAGGWWWTDPTLSNRRIRRAVLRRMLASVTQTSSGRSHAAHASADA